MCIPTRSSLLCVLAAVVPSRKERVSLFAIISALLLSSGSPSALALDDHNPIGVTGVFEGITTTGCAYNVLNHNARREFEDIVVPGAIGKYGLKMVRYYNSRRTSSWGLMGPGWSHEYLWTLNNTYDRVEYPNGNVWENHCTAEWGLQGPLGVSDWRTGSTFRLADGGTVVFGNGSQATEIIDPYNLTTTLTYYDPPNAFLLKQVTEPGGRYLYFRYNGSQQLSEVDAYDSQGHLIDYVLYTYTLQDPGGQGQTRKSCLVRVDYSDGTSATYTYTTDNVPDTPAQGSAKIYPLLSTCNDVRYHGPMRQIAYEYENQGPHGAILKEKYSTGGAMVSRIDPPLGDPRDAVVNFITAFTEYRGDGPSRTFNYSALHLSRRGDENCPIYNSGPPPPQRLESYTDFKGNTTTLGYDGNKYVNSVTDANGQTLYSRGNPPYAASPGIGEILSITYPNNTGTIQYGYESPPQYPEYDPHYLTSVTILRGASSTEKTVHTRDSNHRITQTNYYDGNTLLASETFTYCVQADSQCSNNSLGQIKTQKLKNGAYVHYRYDSRGLLVDKWEPTWTSTAADPEPKTHYTYYGTEISYSVTINGRPSTVYPWADRVKTVTLPANVSTLQASDTFEYDRVLDPNGITNLNGAARPGRGLVTKITHVDTPTDTYQQFKYDAWGNKRWEDNEARNATSYTYDEYNRLTNVTRPLNGITTYTYNPTNGAGSRLSHTTSNPDTVSVRTSATTPNLVTRNVYDENFRKISSTAADGSPSAATTFFHYDAVGNQDWVTDPRGTVGRTWPNGDPAYTTYFDYDERNRKTRVSEPLGRVTQFFYDDKVNVTQIIRTDNTTETKVYDGMNRVTSDKVPKEQGVDIITQFQYNPWNGDNTDSGHSASLLRKVIDGNSNPYEFKYDAAGLKTKMIYPDGSSQSWAYDDVHNLKNRTAVGAEVQSFTYDKRNRKVTMNWSNGADSATYGYDLVGRLTSATNANSAVTRQYDGAGRLMYDQQNVTGLGSVTTVNYAYYDDANLKQVSIGPGYDFTYLYDGMRRLEKIQATGGSELFQYFYDAASNEIGRDNILTGVSQAYPRDELNRMKKVTVSMANYTAREEYDYEPIGRLRGVTHEYDLQDRFDYYRDGELKSATYFAVPTPSPPRVPRLLRHRIQTK